VKPTVDSRQLNAFVTLARCGSFTRASKELFLTQSAVSHAMKALESDLGCRLLSRLGKRVQLTRQGEVFLKHAENILREMKSARYEIEIPSVADQGRLRVGVGTIACQHLLPAVLREFRENFPKCIIEVELGDQRRQLDFLRRGHVDLAVLLEPEGEVPAELEFVPLFEDELRIFVSPQHPWANYETVPNEAYEAVTVFFFNKAGYTFQIVSKYLKDEGVVLRNFIELGSIEAIKELVKLGLGVAMLAPWLAGPELENGSLVSLPLGPRKLRRQWCVAHWKGRRLTEIEKSFLSLCDAEARNFASAELRAEA
jgi:LysR family transcriptional regulator, low CO2-responsive transcriptional regulator